MIARRKSNLHLPPRMYVYKGKRKTTYYTITPGNERINLGHDFAEAKRKLIEIDSGCRGFESHQPPQNIQILKKVADYKICNFITKL